MAQVVELFGAPGTGKTSLMRALDGRRVGGRRIVAAQRLTRVPRRGPLGRLRGRALTPAERRAALSERREDWSDLLACMASSSRDLEGDPIRALNAPGWLAATLELRALADTAPDDVVVVLDEGLVQRVPIVCGQVASDECIDRFLRVLPTTALHVHLQLEPLVLMTRLRERDRVIDRHRGLDDLELEASVTADADLLARCATVLSRMGTPLISASGAEPVGTLAVRITERLAGPA